MTALFAQWRKGNAPCLAAIAKGDHPKVLIETLSEDLLDTFGKAPLLDAYDVYQHLMDYWEATMQDDVYIISASGWAEGARVRQLIPTKNPDRSPGCQAHRYRISFLVSRISLGSFQHEIRFTRYEIREARPLLRRTTRATAYLGKAAVPEFLTIKLAPAPLPEPRRRPAQSSTHRC